MAWGGRFCSICCVMSRASLWDGIRSVRYAWTVDCRSVGC